MAKTDHQLDYDAARLGDALLDYEWLLTNGTGAFSAGTALGVNTRRYHGLLVAAAHPPIGRVAVLNQCFEQLILTASNDAGNRVHQVIELSTMRFKSGDGEALFVPDGHRRLIRFEKGLSARWVYGWGGVEVARELFLHWHKQAATLRYTVSGLGTLPGGACERAMLRLAPMLTLRDFHGLLGKDWAGPIDVRAAPASAGTEVVVTRDGHSAALACSAGSFVRSPGWWYRLHYPIDERRGQDAYEDYFVPGRFEAPLDTKGPAEITLTVSLGEASVPAETDTAARAAHLAPAIRVLQEKGVVLQEKGIGSHFYGAGHGARPRLPSGREINDSRPLLKGFPDPAVFAQAADDFVVGRTVRGRALSTILAGYPWFADWGRDTFIALPGLLLCAGRFDEARATLRAFAEAMGDGADEGLLPNRFDDYDEAAAHYNTVDASLWFVHAAMQYVDASRDEASWRGWLAEACVRVVNAYAAGTGYGIHMAGDGLIAAGSQDTQLTWMDAAAVPPGSDRLHVFTPRPGKCVEINALWFNALSGLADRLPKRMGADADRCAARAAKAKRAFGKTFWNESAGCLFDHVLIGDDGDEYKDDSVRPNQCLAVSLPRSPLAKAGQQSVMRVVRSELLTGTGLRTLPAGHPAYHPWYAGIQYKRDEAYHQGTIWPWLIGPYAEGVLRAGGFSGRAKREAWSAIEPLVGFMSGRGVGQLYEIHQAQPVDGRHPPRGCFAQAWSVGEVIRVLSLLSG